MTHNRPLFKLVAALAAGAMLLAACGDSDDSGDAGDASASATDTAPETTAASDTTASAETTEAGGSTETTEAGDPGETGGVLEFRPLDAGGSITKEALAAGDIDVALLFTSDADIAVNDWVLLEDDQGLQQIENLTPAIRVDATSPEVEAVLNAVSAPLTTPELTELNRQASQDLLEPADIAAAWLEAQAIVPWDGDPVEASLGVGSTNFLEQEIVAELYSQALESAGATIDEKFQLGPRDIAATALESGEIDLYPEYLGSYTNFVDGTATVPSDPATAADQLRGLLEPDGITVLEPAPAEDRNGLVVTRDTADQYGLATTSDLASVPDVLVFGGPPECPDREFCMIGLTEVYGLTFQD